MSSLPINRLPSLTIMISLARRPKRTCNTFLVAPPDSRTSPARATSSTSLTWGMLTVPASQSTKKPRAMTERAGGLTCPGVEDKVTFVASKTDKVFSQTDIAQALCVANKVSSIYVDTALDVSGLAATLCSSRTTPPSCCWGPWSNSTLVLTAAQASAWLVRFINIPQERQPKIPHVSRK